MAVPLAQFVAQLGAAGVMTPAEIQAFQEGLPPEKLAADDAQEFARELVRQRKLTAYQATAVYRNKGSSLVLGNYTVLDKLGQGGMGTVFKAELRRMKRIVALKVMSHAAMKSPDAVKRFLREVEAAARLTHPNIVAAHDANEANGIHFLVMEYVEGIDLAALVKKHGPLPIDKAVHCILQAARGLAHAHAEGVIHRDIKPANLLLDKSGTVKILDMGLARLDDADGRHAELTQTGAVMGTVDYMAPEQALSTKSATAKADMYSLGISLWYLLAGKAAYSGETLMAKLLAHREQAIPSLSSARDDVPAELDAVFRRMVAKHPDDRYPSMAAVVADLEACLAGGIVAATTFSSELSAESPPDETWTIGSRDSAVQDFLQAISPATGPTNVRTKHEARSGEDTFSAGAAGSTQQSRARSAAPTVLRKLPVRPQSLIAGSFAAALIGVVCVWLLPGKKSPSTKSGETVLDRKSTSGQPDTATADNPTEPGQKRGWHGWPADAPPPAIAPFSGRNALQHQEAWARFLRAPVEQTNGLGMKFRLIPPGEFKMGLTDKQFQGMGRLPGASSGFIDSAKPQHLVRLTQPCYMGVREVCYGDFVGLMNRMPGNVPREDWMTDSTPITRGASWYDAVEFCNALSAREGLLPNYRIDGDDAELLAGGNGYRLPTEAEWEFACRAGTETVWFYGLDPQDHLKNPDSGRRTHSQYVHGAGSGSESADMQSNPFGLLGMYAGADEWCWDGFVSYSAFVLAPGEVMENPVGPPSARSRVKRGGASWSGGGSDLNSISSVARGRGEPNSSGVWSGLGRIVLNIPTQGLGQSSESRGEKPR